MNELDVLIGQDFLDIIREQKERGIDHDIPELLEYPCNCKECLRKAGIEVDDE